MTWQCPDPEPCGTPPDELDMEPIEEAVCVEVEDGITEAYELLKKTLSDGLNTLQSYEGCEWACSGCVQDSEVLEMITNVMGELSQYSKPEKKEGE